MLSWLTANVGTVIITLVLIVAVVLIVVVLRRDKKQGKSSCGGNCGHCPMGGQCHGQR